MKILYRLIFSYFVNFAAIFAATYFITDFKISGNIENLLIVIGVFTLINLFIKPILKMIAAPLIILTLGLASLIINALMLYGLTLLDLNVTIASTEALIYATLIITLINVVITSSAKSLYK